MANQKSKGRVTTSVSKSTPAPAAQSSAPKPAATSSSPVAPLTTGPRTGTQIENKPQAGGITREMVAEAAYFLWLERGGNEAVNWLEAEAMLAGKGTGRR